MLHKDIIDSDIIVTNSKGCTSIPIAEHVLAMITSFAKGIPTMLRNEAERKWELIPVFELADVTVGIIGYGEIGHEIAKRCKALSMKIMGCRRNPKAEAGDYLADKVVGMDEVNLVLNQSDFVVLALLSTEETHHFLNKERISEMKRGSYLINVGRGNAIVDDDLIEALEEKHIAGASLDVFEVEPLPSDHPYWTMDQVIISPHNVYLSPKHIERNLDLFIENLRRLNEGLPLKNVINKNVGY